MVRNRPIVLNNGDYLLPAYHETGHDPENVGTESTTNFVLLVDGRELTGRLIPKDEARRIYEEVVLKA